MKYMAQDLGGTSFTILLVLENANGHLSFFVHPEWRSLVRLEDVNFISELLMDFLERADEQPKALFEQLSSLGVGPLMILETGDRISDFPSLSGLITRFVQL